jgi:5-methyltetrahydropteroyltriglutamate--homocysteine methyltransferase
MIAHNLGYPRIGSQRELKKACEQYWAGKNLQRDLVQVGKNIRTTNWLLQKNAGLELIPSNDFSFYDHVLDMSFTVGAIPARYHDIMLNRESTELDLYFAMARGYQKNRLDITAMEMTKWFDTNYHYIVPEFSKNQVFRLFSNKIINEFYEAKQLGITTKPVLLGPVSFLLLGKEKESGFHRISLLKNLLPVYLEIIEKLEHLGVQWIQFDEPFLVMDLSEEEKQAVITTYKTFRHKFPSVKILLSTYFDGLADNTSLALSLPICALHLDVVRCPEQLTDIIAAAPEKLTLSLGVVDGRNIWKNDYNKSLSIIEKAIKALGHERVMIAPSCSLLHVPCDLDLEEKLDSEIKSWMAFAKQKLDEVVTLKLLAQPEIYTDAKGHFDQNQQAIQTRKVSALIHKQSVKKRVNEIDEQAANRLHSFSERQFIQKQSLNLPLFPTTTIGSFPQTDDIRQLRNKLKKGEINDAEYEKLIKAEIEKAVSWQEKIGLDVLVHGEFERNDMVEYFGEQLDGYVFTQNGWVQSYGSRCVKPPIIFGDIERKEPMTVKWTSYAQSLTDKYMKGMLTGPVTMLQWSFVRDDQSRETTAMQLALAIRDEVTDLEKAGIKIIQIDEPAIREGLPLRKISREHYLSWAVKAFKVASCGVRDDIQIHTHMCYSEFNDIIKSIADLDADVITIETSRSQMELLEAFVDFQYPNEIGPGVYDIHSPRVPNLAEITRLLEKALEVLPVQNLWVNPDCGLKTRKWAETEQALQNMVKATVQLRLKTNEKVNS